MSQHLNQPLGPYRLIERIGQSGLTTVFKACRISDESEVMLKVLPQRIAQAAGFAGRFEHETQIITHLNHPHIMPVYDCGRADDGPAYLVMPYLETEALADRLKEGLSLETAYHLFGQIGQAIAYAHGRDVIHRDLNPSNILIVPLDVVLVADFGLAQIMTGDSALTGGLLVGASDYLSPEQSDGRPADKRSDIYALGILLYEMTTGRRPFEAETPMAVLLKQMTTLPSLPRQLNPDMTPEVEQLILKALAGDPDDRYQEVSRLLHDFQAATGLTLDPLPASISPPLPAERPSPAPDIAPPTTPPPAPSALPRSIPWLWLILGLIGLLLGAGLIFTLSGR